MLNSGALVSASFHMRSEKQNITMQNPSLKTGLDVWLKQERACLVSMKPCVQTLVPPKIKKRTQKYPLNLLVPKSLMTLSSLGIMLMVRTRIERKWMEYCLHTYIKKNKDVWK